MYDSKNLPLTKEVDIYCDASEYTNKAKKG
jgi:hypothetical protein